MSLKRLQLQQQYLSDEPKIFIGISYYNLAYLCYRRDRFEEAQTYNETALKIYGIVAERKTSSLNYDIVDQYLTDAFKLQTTIYDELQKYKGKKRSD